MRLLATKLTSIASAVRNLFWGASLNMNFAGTDTLDPRITFSRASNATVTGPDGVLGYAPHNLLTFSEQFDNAAWTKTRSSISANTAVAPDGTTTADKLVEDTSANATHLAFQTFSAAASTAYVFSCYVKAAERSAFTMVNTKSGMSTVTSNFNLVNGTVISTTSADSKIEALSNGWYRVSQTLTTDAVAGTLNLFLYTNNGTTTVYTGDGTSGLFIWGAQLEVGAFPTSYIPTTTAAATRAADVAVMTGANFSNWYRADEGTLFAEASVLAATTDAVVASLNNGTTSEDSRLRALSSGSSLGFRVFAAGASQAVFSVSGQLTPNAVFRSAGAYKIDDFAFSANGSAALTDSSGFTSTATLFSMGNIASVSYLNGHIRRIAYFPRRLTNSELQGITK